MNKIRRKRLAEIQDKISTLRLVIEEELQGALEECRDEEEEYVENIPENLQGSERYEQAEAAMDYLYTAVENLENAVEALSEAEGNIEEAMV